MISGYERIAFGSIKDPVKLLFCDEIGVRALGQMDLFSVAGIKRVKEGLDIEFYDRMEALKRLYELHKETNEQGSNDFFMALNEGAKALGSDMSES